MPDQPRRPEVTRGVPLEWLYPRMAPVMRNATPPTATSPIDLAVPSTNVMNVLGGIESPVNPETEFLKLLNAAERKQILDYRADATGLADAILGPDRTRPYAK